MKDIMEFMFIPTDPLSFVFNALIVVLVYAYVRVTQEEA